MFKGFKQFIMRGNVVDLAVGVVIGAAFNNVVNGLVKGVITPLISAIAHVPNFSGLDFTLRGSKFLIGDFINSTISFLIVAASVYFFVVVPINRITARFKKGEDPTTKECPFCTQPIPVRAKRCPECTSELT